MTEPASNLEHPLGGSNVQLYLPFCLLTVCLSHILPRGKWRHVGCERCSPTSTHQLWVHALPLSSGHHQAASAAWSLALSPPSRMVLTSGWLPWAKWCSAWPPRVAWPCECFLFLDLCLPWYFTIKTWLMEFVFCSTFGMVDSEETCIVVMVYNTADSWGVLIGDTVVIPEPQLKRHSITHKDEVSVSRVWC